MPVVVTSIYNETKWKSYTEHWAGRGSWSHSLKPGGEPHRSVCGPGCDVWAARGSALVCWSCHWLHRTAALLTAQKGWTPKKPQPGAGLAQQCRWPPQFHCHHRSEQLNLQTRRPSAPLWFRESQWKAKKGVCGGVGFGKCEFQDLSKVILLSLLQCLKGLDYLSVLLSLISILSL